MLEVSSFAFVKGPKEVKIKYFYTQKHRENKPFFSPVDEPVTLAVCHCHYWNLFCAFLSSRGAKISSMPSPLAQYQTPPGTEWVRDSYRVTRHCRCANMLILVCTHRKPAIVWRLHKRIKWKLSTIATKKRAHAAAACVIVTCEPPPPQSTEEKQICELLRWKAEGIFLIPKVEKLGVDRWPPFQLCIYPQQSVYLSLPLFLLWFLFWFH